MYLMLTSFGVSHFTRRDRRNTDIFYRMPPASLACASQDFMPDYAVWLVANRIIIDEKTHNFLLTGRHRSYGNVALTAKVLHDEGFVRLENFDLSLTKSLVFVIQEMKRWPPQYSRCRPGEPSYESRELDRNRQICIVRGFR